MAGPEHAPSVDERDRNARDRDAAAESRDVEAVERDRLAKARDRGAADRDALVRADIRAIQRLLWDAEARDAASDDRFSGDDAGGTARDRSEQAAVDLAVASADRRLTALEARDYLDRIDGLIAAATEDRFRTSRDREAAADDRRSSEDDRYASSADRDQAAIERAQDPAPPAP